MTQVTSVSQLRDVSPTDWAFEALRSLVERYGCIVGYPDRTFRGNRALSRYEFAAGLNACMQQMERLIAASEAVTREDIEKLKRLIAEFETELATLGARVDNLEGRVAFLEDHQFSTTTKLSGEVIFGLASIFGGQKTSITDVTTNIPQVPVLGDRVRIELSTSFTGKDLLYTRLATGNFPDFADPTSANTQQASLAFAQPEGNDVAVEVLNYNFPLNDNITVWLEGAGGAFDDFTNTLSILDGDGGSGALSSFGTRNTVYYQGEGAGLALEGKMGSFGWSLGYLATDANNPEEGNGLFNGAYGTLAQIGYYPSDKFGIAFAYGQGYNSFGIGENNRRFAEIVADSPIDTSHNIYSLTMSWKLADKFVLGGWGGYANVRNLNSFDDGTTTLSRGSYDTWYWAATLGFPDLFKEGNLGGIIVGMQPWQTNSTITNNGVRLNKDDTSFHIEAFYEYAITDNIKITPGVIFVTNPGNDSKNDALVIGALRTTFTF
ncbi:MAG: hypothetical protein FWJ34_07395 [Geminocystis sp. GBBB08]|nr:hypothetical protein [Geminocystis sp. GBBB08]